MEAPIEIKNHRAEEIKHIILDGHHMSSMSSLVTFFFFQRASKTPLKELVLLVLEHL